MVHGVPPKKVTRGTPIMSTAQEDAPRPVTDLLATTKSQPGRLRGKSILVLETRHAQMIFEGRKGDIEKRKLKLLA